MACPHFKDGKCTHPPTDHGDCDEFCECGGELDDWTPEDCGLYMTCDMMGAI